MELGESVLAVDGGVGQVTNSSCLNNVADGVSLDGLVLGDGSCTVGASDESDVASAVLVSSSVPSLLGHLKGCSGNDNVSTTVKGMLVAEDRFPSSRDHLSPYTNCCNHHPAILCTAKPSVASSIPRLQLSTCDKVRGESAIAPSPCIMRIF